VRKGEGKLSSNVIIEIKNLPQKPAMLVNKLEGCFIKK
jgi:hypothetical protein